MRAPELNICRAPGYLDRPMCRVWPPAYGPLNPVGPTGGTVRQLDTSKEAP